MSLGALAQLAHRRVLPVNNGPQVIFAKPASASVSVHFTPPFFLSHPLLGENMKFQHGSALEKAAGLAAGPHGAQMRGVKLDLACCDDAGGWDKNKHLPTLSAW